MGYVDDRLVYIHSLALAGSITAEIAKKLAMIKEKFPWITGIEVAMNLLQMPTAELKKILDDLNFGRTACIFFPDKACNPLLVSHWGKAEGAFGCLADRAVEIGADHIVGPTGFLIADKPSRTHARFWEQEVMWMKHVGTMCKTRGQRCSLEALRASEDPILASPDKLGQLVDEVDMRQTVDAHADAFHIHHWGTGQAASLKVLGTRVGCDHESEDDRWALKMSGGVDHAGHGRGLKAIEFGRTARRRIMCLEAFGAEARAELGGIADGLPDPADPTLDLERCLSESGEVLHAYEIANTQRS